MIRAQTRAHVGGRERKFQKTVRIGAKKQTCQNLSENGMVQESVVVTMSSSRAVPATAMSECRQGTAASQTFSVHRGLNLLSPSDHHGGCVLNSSQIWIFNFCHRARNSEKCLSIDVLLTIGESSYARGNRPTQTRRCVPVGVFHHVFSQRNDQPTDRRRGTARDARSPCHADATAFVAGVSSSASGAARQLREVPVGTSTIPSATEPPRRVSVTLRETEKITLSRADAGFCGSFAFVVTEKPSSEVNVHLCSSRTRVTTRRGKAQSRHIQLEIDTATTQGRVSRNTAHYHAVCLFVYV